MRLMVLPFVLAAVLTGCGADSKAPSEARAESPTPVETPTLTPTPPPTPTPTPGVKVTYRCQGQVYENMQDAWVGEHSNCIDTTASGSPNQRERAAVRLAYGKHSSPRDVEILYGVCGSNNPDWPVIFAGDTNSAAWAQERRGAALLCPAHPHIDQVAPALAATEKQVEVDRNKIEDGTHLVGTEVRPGTYVATPTESCYWERTDTNGEIIDNNFSNGARVQFTILPSDHSVSVEGCGVWRRVR